MKSFTLELLSPASADRITDVVSFVGRDDSGSFGILADAARRITVLSFGLAQIRFADGTAEYLALPSGLLYFVNNTLRISCESCLRSSNREMIAESLRNKFKKEESAVSETRKSLHRLDEEILRRLSRVRWGSAP